MTAIASIDPKCLIRILEDEGFVRVRTVGVRVVMEKPGYGPALIIRTDSELSHTEILDWLDNAGITLERFIELRYKHCPP
jgi:predicted RNA binding protein YcfA (HicA-like mRNA interferase family)